MHVKALELDIGGNAGMGFVQFLKCFRKLPSDYMHDLQMVEFHTYCITVLRYIASCCLNPHERGQFGRKSSMV